MLDTAETRQSKLPLPFIREALLNPIKTGALAPSSQGLAREMTRYMPNGERKLVVELGPGTGSFTRLIAAQLQNNRFLALEVNSGFHRALQHQFPHLDVIHESAENINSVLRDRDLDSVDLVVSGLPWAVFGRQAQHTILQATCDAMAEDGIFSTFAYVHALQMPGARRFRTLLRDIFPRVVTSKIVWKNAPPAIALHCFKDGRR